MNSTPNTIPNFSRGCPCVPVDGDIAAQEEQTVSRLELHSINFVNSPVLASKSGLDALPPNETISDQESHLENNPLAGSSSALADATMHNENGSNRVVKLIEDMERRKKKVWNGIGKKQGIKIATLNMNGRRDERKRDKWPKMTNLMRSQGIAILGLQESHLNVDEAEHLNEAYPRLIVINNGTSTSKEGVTFVLNKDLINGMKWQHTPIIENRVSILEIETEQNRGLNIVLVYAPNIEAEKIAFWKVLKVKLKEIGNMDNMIVMGDFNSVENALDRYPHREDDENVKQSWKAVRNKFKLVDGWRVHNPIRKDYTFNQKSSGSMSRIDRIYLDESIYVYGYNWDHVETAMSDHNMVTVDLLKAKLPFIGKGVWRMYQDDIDNKVTVKRITKLMETTSERFKIAKENPTMKSIQRIWSETKGEIKIIATEERKKRMRQLNREKNNLKKGIEKRLERLTGDANEMDQKYRDEIIGLRQKLMTKVGDEQTKMRLATKVRYRQKGEKCTKYWFGLNKQKMGDNTILALTDKNGKLSKETKIMGEIAVQHHETLQKKPEMTENRKKAIKKLAKIVKEKKISKEQKSMLKQKTSREEIEIALKNTANGTSPGIDGIPYELYKEIIKKEKKKESGVDVIGILHDVINDIEINGIEEMTTESKKENEFTDGLMFLLFKKNDKRKIENYRPITLLNTDYKIYTKTIANRLANVAVTIVHEDQAGFIPGRSLYDHTKTTQMVIEYCEVEEKDGCIIALDQEKAYDKIDHEYLWIILRKYGFPTVFIERIMELYRDTKKAIMINGIVTRKYKVDRGVHQGDPMSCLLYDLAIEPLAEALRKSELRGIEVNKNIDRLIVNLFADDTLVYLSKEDDMNILDRIIKKFCTASTAKFNIDKTEILPVGKKEFREDMINNRKMGVNVIGNDKRLIAEGESMRTLGSWVGNGKTDTLQWGKIIKAQEKVLDLWSKMRLTMKGKELILKSLVQSKAVFLATVNGMPVEVEEEMRKMYHSFLWENKTKGLIKWEQAIVRRSQGGLGIPDIAARIEAIEVMWVKKWLSAEPKRPKWAYILDMILSRNIAKKPIIDNESRMSWLIQSWHESEAKAVKLSGNVKRMLRVARKYNVTPIAPKYDVEAKRSQPLWHNIMMRNANYQWNKKSARCLRQNHNIKTIGDLLDWDAVKNCSKACNTMTERLIGMIPERINPLLETPKKVRRARLDLTPRRLKKNRERKNKKVFNPDITVRKNWENAVRIFADGKGPKTRRIKNPSTNALPAYRDKPGKQMTKVLVTLAKKNKDKHDEATAVGIKIKNLRTGIRKVKTFKVKGDDSSDRARAIALIWILKETKKSRVDIQTDDAKMINWVDRKLNEAEAEGWLDIENANLWRMVLRKLRKKGDRLRMIRAQKGSRSNKKVARLKVKIKENDEIGNAEIRIGSIDKFNREGAQLDIMTQKRAYELIIRQKSETPGGMKTMENMEKIKEAALERGYRLRSRDIWNGLKNIYSPQVMDFIWKMIHGRIKCGPFFRYIPNWQEKEFCSCGASESIEHILCACEESGQSELWTEVKEKWSQETGNVLGDINVGLIMGLGSVTVKSTRKLDGKPATLLLRKLIALTAWTIWKERNDRIFNEKEASSDRLKMKWEKDMRKEIRMDLWEKTENKRKKLNEEVWTTNGTFAELVKDAKGKVKLLVKIGKDA